jgi:hypothetical protein
MRGRGEGMRGEGEREGEQQGYWDVCTVLYRTRRQEAGSMKQEAGVLQPTYLIASSALVGII